MMLEYEFLVEAEEIVLAPEAKPSQKTKKQPSREGCFVRIKQSWWGRLGLNQRPTGYEPAALTPELRPHVDIIIAQLASSGDEFMRNNHSYYQNLSFFGSFGNRNVV